MTHRRQLTVYFILLLVNAFAAFASYAFFGDQLMSSTSALAPSIPAKTLDQPMWFYGLANAALVLVAYGILGLIGYFAARKSGLPGIYSPGCGWRRWVVIPLLLGAACAVLLVVGDLAFAPINGLGRLPHPTFPISILATISAGIGEEIEFRLFVFAIWALILTWLFKRFNGRVAALWIANVIAALAFAGGHFFSLAMISGAATVDAAGQMVFLFDKMNPMLVVEAVLLNGVMGLLAGWRLMKDGLVAAAGVHFWADIFWHVLWGLIP